MARAHLNPVARSAEGPCSPESQARAQPALPPAVCASSSGSAHLLSLGHSPQSSPAASSPWMTQVMSLYLQAFSWRCLVTRALKFMDPRCPSPTSTQLSRKNLASLLENNSLYFPNEQCPRVSLGAPTASDSAEGRGTPENGEEPVASPYQPYFTKHTHIKHAIVKISI